MLIKPKYKLKVISTRCSMSSTLLLPNWYKDWNIEALYNKRLLTINSRVWFNTSSEKLSPILSVDVNWVDHCGTYWFSESKLFDINQDIVKATLKIVENRIYEDSTQT